ncbi:hypothetical protein [Acetobacter okinawensis]|uniref:hypothetical protein n=1 Tax=Acetobacter okinawensis TaxID=1076594 RepID=UPI001BAD8CE3|nr:hypothetical protein [Acetobacter okinawensis]MBS0988637.1 hypothetical protein [Acetobacter okinawensis]MCP1213843.1 hypothetical protein [Acetobacter okinawensis]
MLFKICTSERNIRIIAASLAIAACSMTAAPRAIADTRPKALTTQTQLHSTKDVITMTIQMHRLLGITPKTVNGKTLNLSREAVTEYSGYVEPSNQDIEFLREGENVPYIAASIHAEDSKQAITHYELIPDIIQTGLRGTYKAYRLANNDIKIDVTLSYLELQKMPDCMDTQCPETLESRYGSTLTLPVDHAEAVDFPLGDSRDQSIRLIFSRKQLPQQVKPEASGMPVHRT